MGADGLPGPRSGFRGPYARRETGRVLGGATGGCAPSGGGAVGKKG